MAKIYENRYECLECIGRGGMASVFLAFDRKLQRQVALKVMHEHMQGKEALRQRFRQEVYSVSKLKHPNVLEIYDFSGEEVEDLWLVMEYIEGYDLNDYTSCFPHFQIHPLVASCIIREVGKALSEAHKHGIIHRDVKSSNIMVSYSGQIKLMDFGIAKNLIVDHELTQTGSFIGSPSYMPPEQVKGEAIDARADIYALSVLFFKLLTGRLPYEAEHSHQIMDKVLMAPVPKVQDFKRATPSFLSRFIYKGMAKDPRRRHQAVSSMVGTLDQYLRRHELGDSGIELELFFSSPKEFAKKVTKNVKIPTDPLSLVPSSAPPERLRASQKESQKKSRLSQREAQKSPLKEFAGEKKEARPARKKASPSERVGKVVENQNPQRALKKNQVALVKSTRLGAPKIIGVRPAQQKKAREATALKQRAKEQRKKSSGAGLVPVGTVMAKKKPKGVLALRSTTKTQRRNPVSFPFLRSKSASQKVLPGSSRNPKRLVVSQKRKSSQRRFETIVLSGDEAASKKKVYRKTMARRRGQPLAAEWWVMGAMVGVLVAVVIALSLYAPSRSWSLPPWVVGAPSMAASSEEGLYEPIAIETLEAEKEKVSTVSPKVNSAPQESSSSAQRAAKVGRRVAPRAPTPTLRRAVAPVSKMGALHVFVTPSAKVYLNRKPYGASPQVFKKPLPLRAGSYSLELQKSGYEPYGRSVVIKPGQTLKLGRIHLRKITYHDLTIQGTPGTYFTVRSSDYFAYSKSMMLQTKQHRIKLRRGAYHIVAQRGGRQVRRQVNLPNPYGPIVVSLDF